MILSIDQGTSGTTCLVVDGTLRPVGRGYRELRQHFPEPGWVEHDPEEIWVSVLAATAEALSVAGIGARDARRDRDHEPAGDDRRLGARNGAAGQRAIVWQDRRTAARCRELPRDLIRTRTGSFPTRTSPRRSSSGSSPRTAIPASELAFGTIDSWLAWKLTGGAEHVTDVTNASRTMLFDLDGRDWDDELLALFSVDRGLLPRVVPSSGVVGEASLLGAAVPLAALAGDQQSALFGQGCFSPGEAKATYGTGSFVLANIGGAPGPVADGLLKTAAAAPPGAGAQNAAEGAVLVSGAALQWLRDGLGILDSAAESEEVARTVESSGGVSFVPALTGLGSPHWNPDARGTITGITRGTTRGHLVRAALEAIAHQVADVLEVLPLEIDALRADGGASANGVAHAAAGRPQRLPRRGRRGDRGDGARRRDARRARRRRHGGTSTR